MYNKILLPTDGSEGMEIVIDHALQVARRDDATIHALYVVDTATMGRLPMDTSWEAVSGLLQEEGQRALDAVREAAEGIAVDGKITEGAPSSEIVDYADAEDVDLIIMGTHGRGGLGRLLLGSVAERVVRTATVPVLTIRVGEPPGVGESEH